MAVRTSGTSVERHRETRAWRASWIRRAASLTPFGLALALWFVARTYVGHALTKPPEVIGLPLGLVAEGLVLAWAALGVLVTWTTASRMAAALAMVFMTLPSMLAIIFTPAIILIMQNLP